MDIIQAIFVLLITYFFILKFAKLIKVSHLDASKIFIWRTIICLAYILLLDTSDLDSFRYYDIPKTSYQYIETFYKTSAIQLFTIFLKDNLYLSFVSCSLIHSFIGSIGSITLFSIIKNLTKNSDKKFKILAESIVYLPTLNLWTSCIGKDSIAFACINLIIFALIKIRTRFLLLLFCGVLLGIVRPYIGFIVFFSSIISFLGRKMGIPLLYKFLIISISIFLLIFFNNINFVFLRFDALDIETLSRVFEFYQEKNIGSTSIDISSYSLPMKIFTYLFRPLFFDAKGLYMLLMSIENNPSYFYSLFNFNINKI